MLLQEFMHEAITTTDSLQDQAIGTIHALLEPVFELKLVDLERHDSLEALHSHSMKLWILHRFRCPII